MIQVLGIPWDIDTEGLREYMSKFGELEDCIVMKVSLYPTLRISLMVIKKTVTFSILLSYLGLSLPMTVKFLFCYAPCTRYFCGLRFG